MNKRLYLAFLLTILMTLSIILTPASAQNGARSQELWIIPYANPDAVYAALKLPSSDPDALEIMNWPLTGTQYEDATGDPDILLARTVESGMREFDLNNNETCKVYPGVPSPTGYPDFRKALAHLTDKDYITEVICEGFAARLDVPIPYSAVSWWNPAVTGANYPYPYDPCAADLLLDGMGFVEGTTPNPDYDPTFPCSANNIRVYPNWYWYHENPHESKCDPDHDHEQPYMWELEKAVTGTIKVFADPACPYTNCLYPDYDPPDPPEDCCEYRELALGWEYTYDAPSNTVTVWINLKICSMIAIWYQAANTHAGEDIQPLVFYARSDDPLRYGAAVHLKDNMEKMGIPVDFKAGDSTYCYTPVIGAFEYHIYTGGWRRLGGYPTYLYHLYHTDWYMPWWYNYIYPHCYRPLEDAISLDPRSDQKVAAIYYTETLETAQEATIAWQEVFMENCINIPLWSQVSYYAYRNLLSTVNMAGLGLENEYNFLSCYRVDDPTKPVRMGNNQPPKSLNILESGWTYEYAILDRMHTPGGILTNPYDLGIYQAWVVQDWHTTTWYDAEDGEIKTKTTYWLRKGVMYHTPVTGAPYRELTAQDCVFTASETQAFPGCRPYSGYNDVHHIKVVDDYCFEVYYNSKSHWFQYAADGYPYLPKDMWLDSSINDYFTETFVVGTDFTDSADMVMTEWPVVLGYDYKWCTVSLTKDATDYTIELFADSTVKVTEDGSVTWKDCWPLEDPDKQLNPNTAIRTDSGFKPWLNFTYLAGLTMDNGDSFTVSYYAGVDDTGLTPGNEYWQTIFTGVGEWYMKEMPDISGPFVFGKCSQFFMETPPLGEIDWDWWWDVEDDTRGYYQTVPSGPCTTRTEYVAPRTGYFKIDVYDMATVIGAHNSTGNGVPDPNWFPGADIFLLAGLVDAFDCTVVSCNYELEFGHPPMHHSLEEPVDPIYDVALIDVTPLKTVVTPGELLPINVTVENQGDTNVTLFVGIRANLNLVARESVALAIGETTTITLIWDTTGFEGSYTLSAYAGPAGWHWPPWPIELLECDLDDNILIYGTVKANIPPVARFTVSTLGRNSFSFDASASYDLDGTIISYAWDFESDSIIDAYGVSVNHGYADPGFYMATLSVTDNATATTTVSARIAANVMERAWPEHQNYKVSKDEDDYNTLFATVRNHGTIPGDVKLVYTTYDKRTGIRLGPILQTTTTLAVEETRNLQVDFYPPDFEWLPETKVKYDVEVELFYFDESAGDWILAQKSKIRFTVAP